MIRDRCKMPEKLVGQFLVRNMPSSLRDLCPQMNPRKMGKNGHVICHVVHDSIHGFCGRINVFEFGHIKLAPHETFQPRRSSCTNPTCRGRTCLESVSFRVLCFAPSLDTHSFICIVFDSHITTKTYLFTDNSPLSFLAFLGSLSYTSSMSTPCSR